MAKDVLVQAKNFLEKLNRNQKWILGVLATVVIGGIIALIVAISEPTENVVLFDNLETADAARIVEYLRANQIDYQPISNTNTTTILVPQEKVDEIRMDVMGQDLIQDSYVGYELFDKTNLGMSEYLQQLNGRRALEGELQRMIKSMEEIRDVSVKLTIPKKELFKEQEKQPTAAVKLRFKSRRGPSKISIEGIQNLVASSVEGLTPDKVTVTDNSGRTLSEPPLEENSLAGITSDQQKAQIKLENYYSDKVQALLDPAFGRENTKVKVNTEIDFDQLQVNKTDYDPERQVERSEQTISDNHSNIDTSFVPGINQDQERLNEIRNYEIAKADSHYVKGIGGIRRLTVTAIVNEKVEVQKLPNGMDTVVSIPRTQEELTGITNAIKTSVGFDEQRGDQVNILCVPFVELLADKVTEINEQNYVNSIQWYEKEDTQKLLLLLLILLVTGAVMFKIIHAKFAKDKMRVAMGLPVKLEQPKLDKFDSSLLALPEEEEDDEDEEEEDEEEQAVLTEGETQEEFVGEEFSPEDLIVEELMEDFDDDFGEMELDEEDVTLLPDELPEQLFLDGGLLGELDIVGGEDDELMEEEKAGTEGASLIERAKAALAFEQQAQPEEVSEDELIKMELRDRVTAFITDQPDLALKLFRVFYNQEEHS